MTERLLGKILYGALFALLLPVLLVMWASAASDVVALPVPAWRGWGAAIASAGVLLMAWGMAALRVHGGGLPMNAFPPPRLVSRGPYAIVSHPIYVGFVIACAGVSIAVGSSAGLWLITPVTALGYTALVLGYEGIELRRRFGEALPRSWLALPSATGERPTLLERLSAWALVIGPWTLAYLAIASIGPPPDARSGALAFERGMPVLEWTEAVYASIYPAVLLAPFAARTRRDLRDFMAGGLLAMALVFPLFLIVPLVAPPRDFAAHGILGRLLAIERSCDTPAAAFPSFHVVWALLVARTVASGRRRATRSGAWTWAAAVAASCWTTGMHTLVDVVAGVAAYAAVVRAPAIWERARDAAERVANSWTEWRIGRARVISHGLYAALAGASGFGIMLAAVGREHLDAIAFVTTGGLLGSALWAQIVEGSSGLSRPFGFFGGLFGICACALASPWFGLSPWLVLGAACLAGPFTQSFGRLRCLVQGCCHGARSGERIGIHYTHPRSRVVRLSELGGLAVHPTPLYSIVWNVVVALAMIRLWMLHARLHLVGGLYLVLMGLGRFVEEAYRGEPQTPVYSGLRLYQWVSIGVVVSGAACIALGRGAGAPSIHFDAGVLVPSAAFGIVSGLAMGVDFPESRRRLSRLA